MKLRNSAFRQRFKTHCRCILHDQWSQGIETTSYKIDASKRFRSAIITDFRSKGLLSDKANILCNSCYKAFSLKYGHNLSDCSTSSKTSSPKPDNTLIESLRIIINRLSTTSFQELYAGNESLWDRLFELLGSCISQSVYSDGKSIESAYKQTEFLIDIDILKYIKQRNKLLVKFLCGLSNRVLESESQTVIYTFACTLEMCYHLKNTNLVLPNTFLANLVQSCISGSKSVSVVNGKTTPGGGYTTYRSWIQLKGKDPLTCMKGTLDIFFDNIGKYVVKNYRVSSDSPARADIITTAIQILPENECELQQDPSLKPHRPTNGTNLKETHAKMEEKIGIATKHYREYRYRFLYAILNEFINHVGEDEQSVNQKMQDIRNTCSKICPKCETIYQNGLKRKCNSCHGFLLKYTESAISTTKPNRFYAGTKFDIGEQSLEQRPVIKMLEPVLVNPNSYKNVQIVLDEMKVSAKIGIDREWVFLGCDGPPYCYSERIIDRDPKKYDYVHMVPGLGHMHMNQMKTLFKVLEDVILEPLGKDVLNFHSSKAFSFFINAKDTHKSWQAIQILLFGTSFEIIRQYVFEMQNSGADKTVSVLGFLDWAIENKNPTISLITELLLNFVLPVFMFKNGVRCNDAKLIDAARFKFEDLFYAFNHPYYREVSYRDLKNRVLYPPAVQKHRDKFMSYSTTKIARKSQGQDFILEGKVQRQKLIAPKGPIKASTWQTLSRCLDSFETIYESVSKKLHLPDTEKERLIDLNEEILTWRAVLRDSKFLSAENYSDLPRSISHRYLSNDMANFTKRAESLRKLVWKQVEDGVSIVNVKYDFLKVMPGKVIDDLLYVPPSDGEYEEVYN